MSGVRSQRLVDDAVEQVFDGPGELADELRADHAAAALQRVEGAADVDQRFLILRILVPAGNRALELRDLVLRFFDEQLEEFRIDLAVGRFDAARAAQRPWRRRRRRTGLGRRTGAERFSTAVRSCSVGAASVCDRRLDHNRAGVIDRCAGFGERHSAAFPPGRRHVSALSSMYQGSLRPACSVSM